MNDSYDIIVIGGGLGGLTAAKRLADAGRSVLLAEQHSQFGGLATYFKRPGHIFDVALHGFPIGMKKSLRKYWGRDFADRIVQVERIRFSNPQFELETRFDKNDFTRLLIEQFGQKEETVHAFYQALDAMNYYDENSATTRELFQRFFPGRTDVWRLLMEPIAYANGSTLDDPALTYGIVFGNFMSKGVFLFDGGTDLLLKMMLKKLRDAGAECHTGARVERITFDDEKVSGAVINGQPVSAKAVISNGSLPGTLLNLAGADHLPADLYQSAKDLRVSCSSCQVYIGFKPDEGISPPIGDLIFHSTCPEYDAGALAAPMPTSRTFSVYYPELRDNGQCAVVASMNARYDDWAKLSQADYRSGKENLIENALEALEEFVPHVRSRVDWLEAATPKTFERYTSHLGGASFGTKFEGLQHSMDLPKHVPGLFHVGSVGIIMSGWLGAANYGVIVANETDKYLAGA